MLVTFTTPIKWRIFQDMEDNKKHILFIVTHIFWVSLINQYIHTRKYVFILNQYNEEMFVV